MALEDAGVTTEDLRNFIATEEELPFPHQVPNFPLKRDAGVGLAGRGSMAAGRAPRSMIMGRALSLPL